MVLSKCALLCALLASTSAHADIVRLKVSADTFGQGWMFLDQDGRCKVVTAAHVVRGIDGLIRQPLVIDGRGREWTTSAPIVISADPDVAVLPVPSATDPASCGEGRLSAIGIARRVADLTNGVIAMTGQSEVIEVPVSRRASAVDSGGGELFTVRPQLPADRVRKGWSGSVVLDQTGPVGIVYEVDPEQNEAYAIRVDVVRRLMATTGTNTPPSAASPNTLLAVLVGSTIDPELGPDQLLSHVGGAWQVTPQQRTVVFVARFTMPIQIRRVQLTAREDSANRIEAIDIGTRAVPNATEWTEANYCRSLTDTVRIACDFLARTVVQVRVVVKTRVDKPIQLGNLVIE